MTNRRNQEVSARRLATVATIIGAAHLVVPAAFDGINARMFPTNTRRHVYINGVIETSLGLTAYHPATRKLVAIGAPLYAAHLLYNLARKGRSREMTERSCELRSLDENPFRPSAVIAAGRPLELLDPAVPRRIVSR